MRLTIIPTDGTVIIDGKAYSNLDLSSIDTTVNAVQWYDTQGEVELKDPTTGNMTGHRLITSVDEFQTAIDLWQAAEQNAMNK